MKSSRDDWEGLWKRWQNGERWEIINFVKSEWTRKSLVSAYPKLYTNKSMVSLFKELEKVVKKYRDEVDRDKKTAVINRLRRTGKDIWPNSTRMPMGVNTNKTP